MKQIIPLIIITLRSEERWLKIEKEIKLFHYHHADAKGDLGTK
jgi:hypothetical protein